MGKKILSCKNWTAHRIANGLKSGLSSFLPDFVILRNCFQLISADFELQKQWLILGQEKRIL